MQHRTISILGLPDATHSTVAGLADTFNAFHLLRGIDDGVPETPPFTTEIIGCSSTAREELPYRVQRDMRDVTHTDIVIVPSLAVDPRSWQPGGDAQTVAWLEAMHASGAMLCSTCSGALLLAQTGLLDGREATTHWAYAGTFRKHFPQVTLRLENMLVQSGARQEIVMSGASGSWHDLALYLIAHNAGIAAAQLIAKFMLLEWHVDGQMPFEIFRPSRDHDDAVVHAAQDWLEKHLDAPSPVECMTTRSGISARNFKRRFSRAVGYSPIEYVQHLRVDAAKRRLERSNASVEEIAWQVGYENPAFFRRLFRRMTGISPSAYRRKLQLPAYAQTTRQASS